MTSSAASTATAGTVASMPAAAACSCHVEHREGLPRYLQQPTACWYSQGCHELRTGRQHARSTSARLPALLGERSWASAGWCAAMRLCSSSCADSMVSKTAGSASQHLKVPPAVSTPASARYSTCAHKVEPGSTSHPSHAIQQKATLVPLFWLPVEPLPPRTIPAQVIENTALASRCSAVGYFRMCPACLLDSHRSCHAAACRGAHHPAAQARPVRERGQRDALARARHAVQQHVGLAALLQRGRQRRNDPAPHQEVLPSSLVLVLLHVNNRPALSKHTSQPCQVQDTAGGKRLCTCRPLQPDLGSMGSVGAVLCCGNASGRASGGSMQ